MEPKELTKKIEQAGESPVEKNFGSAQKQERLKSFEQLEQSPERPAKTTRQEVVDNQEINNLSAGAQSFSVSNQLVEREKKVEKILEEGLQNIYAKLSEEKKLEFRRTGEATAHQINLLLSNTKVKLKKIISLIRDWLKLIPGINFFFLEQEAKIKADEIIKLKKEG